MIGAISADPRQRGNLAQLKTQSAQSFSVASRT
jgi:hypothetical protein